MKERERKRERERERERGGERGRERMRQESDVCSSDGFLGPIQPLFPCRKRDYEPPLRGGPQCIIRVHARGRAHGRR